MPRFSPDTSDLAAREHFRTVYNLYEDNMTGEEATQGNKWKQKTGANKFKSISCFKAWKDCVFIIRNTSNSRISR